MDFNKYHEPYKGEDSPSPEAQLKWLLRNQIPQDIASRAMLLVYGEIEQGKVFEATTVNGKKRSAGWNLCQYLLKTAKDLYSAAMTAYLDSLANADEQRRQKIKDGILEKQPRTFFQRVKAVFRDPYKEVR